VFPQGGHHNWSPKRGPPKGPLNGIPSRGLTHRGPITRNPSRGQLAGSPSMGSHLGCPLAVVPSLFSFAGPLAGSPHWSPVYVDPSVLSTQARYTGRCRQWGSPRLVISVGSIQEGHLRHVQPGVQSRWSPQGVTSRGSAQEVP
jgi:cation diffusion facilitator CzcD-associated flavoprotein CzcO